ncbi:MAG: SDR family oxidoreductase [Propionibacteriaceae bacterium]|nr:SDR family oxidoreductase [Propionibacteriaceae bacterium]
MTTLFDLHGRVALVTGSSQGIGLVLATGLAEAGAHVILHGRDATKIAAAKKRLTAAGHLVDATTFDLTDAEAVRNGVAEVRERFGVPDILVNNAGVQLRGPLTEFTIEQWRTIIDTNLTSAFLMSQAVAAGMVERGSGKIINIGSIQSQLARPSITPYSASKGGIVMLTRGLCADLAKHDIQCNALAPGYFATELTKALVEDEKFSEWVRGRTPAGRWGQTEDLVGTCVFLASDASRFVNGQVIFVDGGMSAVV